MAAAPADAHAELIATSPASGSIHAVPPTEFTLTFNEPVGAEFTSMALSVGGRRVETLPVRQGATSTSVTADLSAEASARPDGSPTLWRVDYRVTSDDGHPIQGLVKFVVDPRSSVEGRGVLGSGGRDAPEL
ncbi:MULTISPECIES: copper resistance CopC family protein [unclassified Nocardioides]|uniref:copper resistance CopC family protein n=1 Tax=unclassified Nocardioides TaxID=2615069 RepID=UPI000A26ED8F|nr:MULTISPECIES: copper resistance CopC family protein [unclassified Nocardioides]